MDMPEFGGPGKTPGKLCILRKCLTRALQKKKAKTKCSVHVATVATLGEEFPFNNHDFDKRQTSATKATTGIFSLKNASDLESLSGYDEDSVVNDMSDMEMDDEIEPELIRDALMASRTNKNPTRPSQEGDLTIPTTIEESTGLSLQSVIRPMVNARNTGGVSAADLARQMQEKHRVEMMQEDLQEEDTDSNDDDDGDDDHDELMLPPPPVSFA